MPMEKQSATFTPGPWGTIRLQDEHEDTFLIGHADGAICKMMLYSEGQKQSAEANARLIAAAPHLLEALSIIVANARVQPDASMGGTTDCYAVPLCDLDFARAALSRATSPAE